MRIALTGSSSTGKTTLAQEISKLIDTLEYLTVDARSIIESFNIINVDNLSKKNFKLFQKEWIKRKRENEFYMKSFVTDRSFIDPLAYMKDRNIIDNVLVEQCVSYMDNYDIVFYVPFGNIPFKSDGYRSDDIVQHENIDKNIQSLLEENKINYYTIEEISVEDRLKYMIRIIKNHESKKLKS